MLPTGAHDSFKWFTWYLNLVYMLHLNGYTWCRPPRTRSWSSSPRDGQTRLPRSGTWSIYNIFQLLTQTLVFSYPNLRMQMSFVKYYVDNGSWHYNRVG